MIKRILTATALVISIICACAIGYAAESFEQAWDTLMADELEGAVIGVGLLYSTQPYIDLDEDFSAVPIIVGRYKNFYSDGTSFGYIFKEFTEPKLRFSAVLKPRFMGYEADDSDFLAGMDDREWSLDGGLRAVWNNDYFSLKLTGLFDLANKHQGQEFIVVASKEFLEGVFTPRIGFKWQSDDITDYYYGVLAGEATAARPAYTGDSTVNFLAGLAVGIPIDEKWAVTLDFAYENLGSEIEDSPIVDAGEVLTYIIGAVYRF